MNLSRSGFRFAWSVEGSYDQKRRDDPRYVKYIVRLEGSKDGEKYEKILPYHNCTEADLE